ncbi:uncharacterized protein EV422DRAFT_339410 [Fimicolochytrium jonesii]|uniref:uncharacterized protein n=1 Tax=Fimicolochytrium jonesii TaxID=1396493 RepID=UPI0022FF07E1|nr:uncharacterized protein EV422DRAFT_339410 [Fimicolochytrium jonesii]KAI8815879.1 hypothetical protein EV422DRAFT_339410 [Fimicolochytrium jonesii]
MLASQKALGFGFFVLVACTLVYYSLSFSSFYPRKPFVLSRHSDSNTLLSSPPPAAEPLSCPPPLQFRLDSDPRLDHIVIIAKTGIETMSQRLLQQVTTFLPRFKNVVYVSDVPGRLGTETIHAFKHPNSALNGWARDSPKYVGGFGLAWSLYPEKDWYFIIDDDTYVFAENLLEFLSPINASIPYQLGWAHYGGSCKMVGAAHPTPPHRMIQGGGGILVSRGTFPKFLAAQQECAQRTSTCLTGDQAIGACLAYIGAAPPNAEHPFGFYMHDWRSGSPRFNVKGVDPPEFWWSADPCHRPVTAHRMREHDVQDAFDAELATDPIRKKNLSIAARSTGAGQNVQSSSWGGWGRTTYADLMEFQLFRLETVVEGRYWYNATADPAASASQKAEISKYRIVMEGKRNARDGVAWSGTVDSEIADVKDIPSCIAQCVGKSTCMAFLYDTTTRKCDLFSRLGGRAEKKKVASGVVRDRYRCHQESPPFVQA